MPAHATTIRPASFSLERSSGGLRIEERSSRSNVESIWRAVEQRAGGDPLAAGWDWTAVWLDHFGDQVPHSFVIASDTEGPCGIALITRGVGQRRGPLPIRSRHIGTAGEPSGSSVCVEYNRLLVVPAHRAEFAAKLVAMLNKERLAWDIVELNGFAPEDAAVLAAAGGSFALNPRVCFVADLKSARDRNVDVSEGFPKGIAAKIRKNLRRFEERYGPITTEWVTDVETARPVFEELIELHQARWTNAGFPGSFASKRFCDFHRALIARLMPLGRIVLFRASAGNQVIGTFYGFIEDGTIYHYQWGLSAFEDNALSPGFVVGSLCMREASERGLNEVNWLAGDVRYKRELSTGTRELVWAEWHRGPWIKAIDTLLAVRANVRARRHATPAPTEST